MDFGGPEIPAWAITGVGNIRKGQYWHTHKKDRGFIVLLLYDCNIL